MKKNDLGLGWITQQDWVVGNLLVKISKEIRGSEG